MYIEKHTHIKDDFSIFQEFSACSLHVLSWNLLCDILHSCRDWLTQSMMSHGFENHVYKWVFFSFMSILLRIFICHLYSQLDRQLEKNVSLFCLNISQWPFLSLSRSFSFHWRAWCHVHSGWGDSGDRVSVSMCVGLYSERLSLTLMRITLHFSSSSGVCLAHFFPSELSMWRINVKRNQTERCEGTSNHCSDLS